MHPEATTPPPHRTPLYPRHLSLRARMAPFGGFDMPIQYTGILDEHQACRRGVAIFDTCHMGEFFLAGPHALADLERLVTCEVATLDIGQCRYGLLCNPDGGVRDDLLVYRLAIDAFMIVVNAGTQDADFDWCRSQVSRDSHLENRSSTTAKLDIQGPASPRLMTHLLAEPIVDLRYYRFHENRFADQRVLVSRTGYTGEIGFEIYCPPDTALALWDACLAKEAVPAGLGARDTLRLEVGMPLYGHELSESRNAGDSGFSAAMSTSKDFIGATAIRASDREPQRLVGLALEGRRAARAGDAILSPLGANSGAVTSGSFSPSLGHAIALGYVHASQAVEGTPLLIQTARDRLPAIVVPRPFYRSGTARQPMRAFL